MFLRGHDLERRELLLPNWRNVEKNLRLPFALFGLMRLEEEYVRRSDDGQGRLMPVSLRDNSSFLCDVRGERMIEVIGILMRMGEDEIRPDLAIKHGQFEDGFVGDTQWIVAQIEKDHFGAEDFRGTQRFVLAIRFDFFERH